MDELQEADELYQERVSLIMEDQGTREADAQRQALNMASDWVCRHCGKTLMYGATILYGRRCPEHGAKK